MTARSHKVDDHARTTSVQRKGIGQAKAARGGWVWVGRRTSRDAIATTAIAQIHAHASARERAMVTARRRRDGGIGRSSEAWGRPGRSEGGASTHAFLARSALGETSTRASGAASCVSVPREVAGDAYKGPTPFEGARPYRAALSSLPDARCASKNCSTVSSAGSSPGRSPKPRGA